MDERFPALPETTAPAVPDAPDAQTDADASPRDQGRFALRRVSGGTEADPRVDSQFEPGWEPA